MRPPPHAQRSRLAPAMPTAPPSAQSASRHSTSGQPAGPWRWLRKARTSSSWALHALTAAPTSADDRSAPISAMSTLGTAPPLFHAPKRAGSTKAWAKRWIKARPWRRRRPTASPGLHTAGVPGAQRPGAPGGAARGPAAPLPRVPEGPHARRALPPLAHGAGGAPRQAPAERAPCPFTHRALTFEPLGALREGKLIASLVLESRARASTCAHSRRRPCQTTPPSLPSLTKVVEKRKKS